MVRQKKMLINKNNRFSDRFFFCSDETLFCISSALTCDGVNQCPSGDEYFSDEDATMCARHKAITATNVSKIPNWLCELP